MWLGYKTPWISSVIIGFNMIKSWMFYCIFIKNDTTIIISSVILKEYIIKSIFCRILEIYYSTSTTKIVCSIDMAESIIITWLNMKNTPKSCWCIIAIKITVYEFCIFHAFCTKTIRTKIISIIISIFICWIKPIFTESYIIKYTVRHWFCINSTTKIGWFTSNIDYIPYKRHVCKIGVRNLPLELYRITIAILNIIIFKCTIDYFTESSIWITEGKGRTFTSRESQIPKYYFWWSRHGKYVTISITI